MDKLEKRLNQILLSLEFATDEKEITQLQSDYIVVRKELLNLGWNPKNT
jgi:hypothetical protein